MDKIIQQAIDKYKNLKLVERKCVLCSAIGLLDSGTLEALLINIEPINVRCYQGVFDVPREPSCNRNKSRSETDEDIDLMFLSEQLVDEVLASSVRIIENEDLTCLSFDEFISRDDLSHTNDKNIIHLPPIEHHHTLTTGSVRKVVFKHKNKRKGILNIQDNCVSLIKYLSSKLVTGKEKLQFLSEILILENWDIQYHIYQCVRSRLNEKWSMESIPENILKKIFSYLSPEETAGVSLVNKRWFSVARDNNLWKEKCILLGKKFGFLKLTDVITENIGEDIKIDWLKIYKTIRKFFIKQEIDLLKKDLVMQKLTFYDEVDFFLKKDQDKQKLKFYDDTKTVHIKPNLNRRNSKKVPGETTSRRTSRGILKINNLDTVDPENDTRQLMKPIIGKLKTFQKSEEIAIDYKPSTLVSITDQMHQSESKYNLRWKDSSSEGTNSGEKNQVKKVYQIHDCLKYMGHLDSVTFVKFDKCRMVSSSLDGSLRMWDSINGRSIRKMYGHKGAVYCLDFYNQILISGGWDTSVIVWSLEPNFSVIKILYGHQGSITSLKFAKKQNKFISASLDGTLRIYAILDFKLIDVVTIRSNDNDPSGIIDMQIEETRNLIATGHCDRSIKIMDVDRKDSIHHIGYQKDILKTIFFQSNLLISGGDRGYLQFWDTRIPIKKHNIKAQVQITNDKHLPLSIKCISYHLKSLWTGHNDGSIKEWHLMSMTCIRTLYGHKGDVNFIYCVEHMMASASSDGSIRVWHLSKSHQSETWNTNRPDFTERIPINSIFK